MLVFGSGDRGKATEESDVDLDVSRELLDLGRLLIDQRPQLDCDAANATEAEPCPRIAPRVLHDANHSGTTASDRST